MKQYLQKAQRLASGRPGLFSVLLALFGVFIVAAPFVLWPQSPPLLVITAESETVQYRIIRPDVAEIPMINALVRNISDDCKTILSEKTNGQISALLKPPKNAIVRYRWSPAAVSIQVQSQTGTKTILEFDDGQSCALPDQVSIVMPKPELTSPAARPLPIVGPAEIGVEIQVPTAPRPNGRRVFGILYGGEIKIFGRTISGALYPAQVGAIAIPAGGRLSALTPVTGAGNRKQSPAWYGMAVIGERAFNISATTETNNLKFFRPGGSSDESTIAVSLFTRLLNDPSLALLSLMSLVFVMSLQAVTGWVSVWKTKSVQEGEPAKEPDNQDVVEPEKYDEQ